MMFASHVAGAYHAHNWLLANVSWIYYSSIICDVCSQFCFLIQGIREFDFFIILDGCCGHLSDMKLIVLGGTLCNILDRISVVSLIVLLPS